MGTRGKVRSDHPHRHTLITITLAASLANRRIQSIFHAPPPPRRPSPPIAPHHHLSSSLTITIFFFFLHPLHRNHAAAITAAITLFLTFTPGYWRRPPLTCVTIAALHHHRRLSLSILRSPRL